eukprot:359240-Chlamydomonas_euryale.AAC.20
MWPRSVVSASGPILSPCIGGHSAMLASDAIPSCLHRTPFRRACIGRHSAVTPFRRACIGYHSAVLASDAIPPCLHRACIQPRSVVHASNTPPCSEPLWCTPGMQTSCVQRQ